jgi:lipopolysaccharide export system protein LptA
MTRFAFLFALLVLPFAATAQTTVSFGSSEQDPDDPIEVTADRLAVSQDDGNALYTGNVIVIQGDMRMASPRLLVIYSEDDDEIKWMEATGGVTVVRGDDAAESQKATYDVVDGFVVMTGDVLLTQKRHAMMSERMVINLDDNTANLSGGRVKTVIHDEGDGN